MGVFHRQLTKDFVRNSALSLIVVALLLSGVNAPRSFDEVFGAPRCINGVSAQYVVFASIIDSSLPFALLLSTLFTVGSLARYQELTALRAAGWSLLQIVRPIIIIALVAACCSVALRVGGYSQLLWNVANDPIILSINSGGAVESLASQTRRHADLAYPLVIFFSVIIGIALGASGRRNSIFAGFGRALGVLVGYNIISAIAQALGRHGVLLPGVAGWLSIIVVGIVTALLWGRAQR